MIQEFVPYKQSLDLKELGFDKPCFGFWDGYNGGSHFFFKPRSEYHWLVRLFKEVPDITTYNQDFLEYEEGCNAVLAPLYQQAFNFFREKYNLHSSIDFDRLKESEDDEDIELYEFKINEQWSEGKDWSDYRYGFKHHSVGSNYISYEEAELECLRKLIEIVKEKKYD